MFFLLADGVAQVTSSGAWEQWATPQGVTALVGAVGTALTLVALILSLLGRAAAAKKVQDANAELQDHKQQLVTAVETIRGAVQGIEAAKKGLDPDTRKQLVATIQDVATKMGAQSVLDPIVQKIQDGQTDIPTLLATLKGVISSPPAPPNAPAATGSTTGS